MEAMEGLAASMPGELQVQHRGCSLKGGGSSSVSVVAAVHHPSCPRCDSPNIKFCYYNNYSLLPPRYFCKTCRRYWRTSKDGALPVDGGCCREKRGSRSAASASAAVVAATSSRLSPNQPRRQAFYSRVPVFLNYDGTLFPIGEGFDEQYLDSPNQDITLLEAVQAAYNYNLLAPPTGAPNGHPFDGGRIWFSGDGEGGAAHGRRSSVGIEYFTAASNDGNRVLHATLLSAGGGVPYGRPFGAEYYTANNGERRIRPCSLFTGGGGGDGNQVDGGSDILDVPALQTSSATINEDIRITIDSNTDG